MFIINKTDKTTYDVIKKLIFTRDQGYQERVKNTLTVTFCDDIFCGDEFTVEFYDVADLKTGDLDGAGGVFLYAYDVSDRQLERIKYHIVDEEFHVLSFYCSDYSVINREII